MSAELPAPLVPADVDLRGYEFMPYYGDRLRDSDLNSRATDAEYRAAHNLWWSAWKQLPAGSLPDEDAVLARLADLGRDLKTWQRVREVALRGFVKCSDGRLYHKVLSPLAVEAWAFRHKQRDRTKAARDARLLQRQSQTTNAHENTSVTDSTGEERTGQDIKTKGSGKESGSSTSPAVEISIALRSLGVRGVNGALHPTIQRWVADGFTITQATDAATIAINDRGVKHPALNYVDAILRDPPRQPKSRQESLEARNDAVAAAFAKGGDDDA